MIERLPFLAAIGFGMALAAVPELNGVSALTTAAGGVLAAGLVLAIWGAFNAGRAAERKANGGVHD
jgi:hypothetical protein